MRTALTTRLSRASLSAVTAAVLAAGLAACSSSDSDGGSPADTSVEPDVPGTDGSDGAGNDADQPDADEEVTPSCPASPCGELGSQSCTGGKGYTVCAPASFSDACLETGDFVPCSGERTCAAGRCFGGCVTPEVVFIVDRSAAMKGTRYAQLFQGLRRSIERTAPGVSYGLVFTGDQGCELGDTVTPALNNGEAVIQALQEAGTGTATELSLTEALMAAEGLLGARGEGERVVLVTANETPCGGEEAALLAAARLRERDAKLRVLWLGDADGSVLGNALAAAGGTDDARVTLDQASITQAVLDLLDDMETCCIDPDGDTRGIFCQGGLDCDETNDQVSSSNCVGKQCGDDGCGGSCGSCNQVNGGTTACSDFQCVTTCEEGFHACGPSCVSEELVASCGDSCSPCPVPTGGTAACVADGAAPGGFACAGECPEGQHVCNGACVNSDSPLHCGDSCDACPEADNAKATCDANACGIECLDGFLDCGGCVACPTTGVADTGCSASSTCVATECAVGYVGCQPDSEGIYTACCDRIVEVLDDGATLVAYPSADVAWPDSLVAAWHHETSTVGEVRVAIGKPGLAVSETIATSSAPSHGRFTRVALDILDTPRVGWRGGGSAAGAAITVATKGAGGWTTVPMADTFSALGYQGGDFALAATPSQQYAVYNTTSELAYATSNGIAATQAVFADEAGADYNDPPAAIVDSEGRLRVLVVEDDSAVVLLTGLAGVTTRIQIDTIANVGAHRIDLAEKSDGTIGMCWLDNTIGGDRGVLYAEEGALSWPKVAVDPDGEESCQLAYTTLDQAIIAYRTLKGEIRIARGAEQGLWAVETAASPSAKGLGLRWPALGLHANDATSVVYWDGDAGTVVHTYFPTKVP